MHTEQDLEKLIEEKLQNCNGYSNVCSLIETDAGKTKIVDKIKSMIYTDGFTDIDACIAQIESELEFAE